MDERAAHNDCNDGLFSVAFSHRANEMSMTRVEGIEFCNNTDLVHNLSPYHEYYIGSYPVLTTVSPNLLQKAAIKGLIYNGFG